jgi:uncharacterized protein (TIGR02284 family)
MATLVGTQKQIGDLLHQLIELDFDAIEAYRAAIARLEDGGDRAQLATFMADHERHVRDLTSIVVGMGQKAPAHADMKQVLTKGKVMLAALVGDRAVLRAMKTNEDDTNTAYERAFRRGDLPSNVRAVVEKNLADERRHRSWLEMRLGLEAPDSSLRPSQR